jgi:Glycosyl-hydrolase 97 N-terminal
MAFSRFLLCLLPLLAGVAHAQDERRVVSPDGQLEFRLFTTLPEGDQLNSLAYQVRWHGKLLLDTSLMGLDIHFQEPFLGENVGLSSAKPLHEPAYNGLFADYLQNSTTGRRIQVEVRVYNDGVAFRYVVPKQFPLLDLLIEDEGTEFHFAGDTELPEHSGLPFLEALGGSGWLGIFEGRVPKFPATSLVRSTARTMMTHLPDTPNDPAVAFVGVTPWTGPWRIIAVGPNRDALANASVVQSLRQ